MSALDAIIDAARKDPKRIVLSEGEDPRIAEGAVRAARQGIAVPILVGGAEAVADVIAKAGGDPAAFEMADPAVSAHRDAYAEAFHALRKNKGVDEAAAMKAVADPLIYAAMMVREGDADGTIGGAVHTTADTVRAAFQVIGRAPGVKTVSSFFLMVLSEAHHPRQETVVFADCGLVIEPSVEELAAIAVASAESFTALTGGVPKVAMLSFSTKGSARHERASRVAQAVELVRAAAPDLSVDGELQFDAAFMPEVAKSKAPGSPVAGQANVLVFPSLEAANIGYKIAQRIGGAGAVGPILQGLAGPANDLSRGCSADDVFDLIAVTGIQAAAGNGGA